MSGEYWDKRFELLEAARHDRANRSSSQIALAFDKAQAQIRKEIESWVVRLAANNGISLAEAKKLLKADELKEFHWDVWEYIKRGREYGLDGSWMKELENASAKIHISRLEAIRVRIQQIAEETFKKEQDIVTGAVRESYTEDYKHTAFELQKGTGIGFDIGGINENKLESIMSKPWTADGLTFSDRIWTQKAKLLDTLQSKLTQACVLGNNPGEIIDDIMPFVSDTVKNARVAAGRLVMTEAAFFGTQAQADCFKDLGVEEYTFVATLDSRTSEICRDMDGQHFKLSDKKTGVTAPPMHCFCRSCISPYFKDMEGGERIARAADGKTYYVPKDMTYREWEKKYAEDAKK